MQDITLDAGTRPPDAAPQAVTIPGPTAVTGGMLLLAGLGVVRRMVRRTR